LVRPKWLLALGCFMLLGAVTYHVHANFDANTAHASAALPSGKSPLPDAAADFPTRCRAAGVVKCIGFDSDAEISSFVYPDSNNVVRASVDKRTVASGEGSLRFEIPPGSGQNSSGGWTSDLGASFHPGDTFYVQFRERFSSQFLKINFQGNGWKQAIFHKDHKTCGSIELTTQNTYARGYPQMYTDCGNRSFDVDLKNGDFLYETGDYNCHRWKPTPASCAYYHADEWMTFYYEVKLGTWGQPESSIRAWVAYEGKAYKRFVDARNFRLDFDSGPNDAFDSITLTPYNTGKPAGINHPSSYIWYDELIVSREPIAVPASQAGALSH
jgi:hypothetical protein